MYAYMVYVCVYVSIDLSIYLSIIDLSTINLSSISTLVNSRMQPLSQSVPVAISLYFSKP